MSTIKIIPNKDCKLNIDQQFVSTIQKGELFFYHINPGVYLIDLFTEDGEINSFDVELKTEQQQVLKRVVFDKSSIDDDVYNAINNKSLQIIGQVYDDRPILAKQMIGGKLQYGYVDKNEKVLIPFCFDNATEFVEEGFAKAEKMGYWHIIDKCGRPSFYDSITDAIEDREEKLLLSANDMILDDGKCINVEWLGSAVYNDFIGRLFTVFSNNMMWVIETHGEGIFNNDTYKLITQCDSVVSSMKEEYLVFKKDERLYALSLSQTRSSDSDPSLSHGELFSYKCEDLIPINYQTTEEKVFRGNDFDTLWIHKVPPKFNLFLAKRRGKYGVIDISGNLVKPFIFDDVYSQQFNAEKERSHIGNEFIVASDGLLGLVDSKFNIIVPIQYVELFSISNDCNYYCAKPQNSDLYILIDHHNNILYSDGFDSIEYGGFHILPDNYLDIYWGHNDYIIERESKKGVLNGEGDLIIPIIFDDIKHVLGNDIPVDQNGDSIRHEKDGYLCRRGNLYGVLSPQGTIELAFEYDDIIPILSDLCLSAAIACKKNGLYALLSLKYENLTDYVYDSIGEPIAFSDEVFFPARKNGRWGLIKLSWDSLETLVPFSFEEMKIMRLPYNECRLSITKNGINKSIELEWKDLNIASLSPHFLFGFKK